MRCRSVPLVLLVLGSAHGEQAQLAPWQRMVASATGYVFGQLAATPLDVVKTRVQAGYGMTQVAATSAGTFAATRVRSGLAPAGRSFRVIRDIARNEGFLGFYRGFGPTLLMMPGVIVQYTIYDELRNGKINLTPPFAAALASFVDVTVRCPFEKLKTVAQAGTGARLVFTVPALWQGYGAQLLRDIPYAALYWTFYDGFRTWLKVDDPAQQGQKGMRTFAAGFAAAAIAASAVTPVDVIKTRIQISQGLNPASAARLIIMNEGMAGLFAGLPARLLRIPLYNAVVIATFELAKDYFAKEPIIQSGQHHKAA